KTEENRNAEIEEHQQSEKRNSLYDFQKSGGNHMWNRSFPEALNQTVLCTLLIVRTVVSHIWIRGREMAAQSCCGTGSLATGRPGVASHRVCAVRITA